jgi:hypothetical protein
MLRIGRPVVIRLASVLRFMVSWGATNHSDKSRDVVYGLTMVGVS